MCFSKAVAGCICMRNVFICGCNVICHFQQCCHAACRLFLYKATSTVPVKRVVLCLSHYNFPRRVFRHQSNHSECTAGGGILSQNTKPSQAWSIVLHSVMHLSKMSMCSLQDEHQFSACKKLFVQNASALLLTRRSQ